MTDEQGGRLAVVSGGGTGIGAAIARGLAEDGYQVAIIGRRRERLELTAKSIEPESVIPIVADLTVPDQVRGVVEALAGATVDVLVNNAGGYVGSPAGEDLEAVAARWRGNFDANVLTAVLLTEALYPALRRPGGRVILFSSIAAQRGGGGPYSAAKAALHGWLYDLARELGPEGVTANVIAPGFVAATEFFGDGMTPEAYRRRVDQTLVGRAGEPVEIAALVRYLASREAGYVTGQILGINGGSVLGR
jgi:3-oxoacyl-[acyl-carrier protein] reductase